MAACNANVRKMFVRTKFEERCGFVAEAEAEEQHEEREDNNLGFNERGATQENESKENTQEAHEQERNHEGTNKNDAENGSRERLIYMSVVGAVTAAIQTSSRLQFEFKTLQQLEAIPSCQASELRNDASYE